MPKVTKKPHKWKKHFVLMIVQATFFGRNLVYIWFEICPSDLSRKKGTLGNISQPTASASKMRPRLQKTFPRFPFFYFSNFGHISNQTWTNFSSDVVSTKIETKYYCLPSSIKNSPKNSIMIANSWFLFKWKPSCLILDFTFSCRCSQWGNIWQDSEWKWSCFFSWAFGFHIRQRYT